ncbi:MAG TPA: low molecular weight protein-tyrosine-phosphatase [Burkholderiaceae bacterium]|nr:low molecular weight protein-tyrosine-phosphatase [Burkholderiaceae bacterium]
MKSLLLVCTANICRSPMAEAVFKAQAAVLGLGRVASAGAHASSRPQGMDTRAVAALSRRKYPVDRKWHSRRIEAEDYLRFDHILAMDLENLDALRRQCPPEQRHKLALLLDLVPDRVGQEVPDPYFGSTAGFENVLDLIELAARSGSMQHLAPR